MIYDNEYLLWDGELETFAEKRATVTNIFFPRYERFIPVTKIGEFGLKQVEKQEAKEVEKPFNRTVESMFNIYKIRTNTRISKIVTGSFTAFKDNK